MMASSMAPLPNEEVDVLKIFDIYFDYKLIWSFFIDRGLTTGALFHVREYVSW